MEAPYFEAHITISNELREKAEPLAFDYGFHMSSITDDEILGPGPKAYATKSSRDFAQLEHEMRQLIFMFKSNRIEVLRYKLESAIIDVRFH